MSGHLEALVEALRDEDLARDSIRDARRRQADAFRELQRAGISAAIVALRVARFLGRTVSLVERRRLAELLRKRADRARTSCPGNLAMSQGLSNGKNSPFAWAIPPSDGESSMPKILKRKVTETEEWVEQEEGEEHENGDEGADLADSDEER
jgi:hypothetical protein